MKLIKQIIIDSPPTKYVDRKKKTIDPKTNKLKETTYYLTANLFYSQQNTFLTNKIVYDCKNFLYKHFEGIPPLSFIRIELIYQSEKDNFDLDNKGYFWLKCILDLIKEPSKRKSNKKSLFEIKPLNIIYDDSCKYLKDISLSYKKGNPKLIVNLYGVLKKKETLF